MTNIQRETEPRPENVWRQIAEEPNITTLRAIALIAAANREAYADDFAALPDHFALSQRQVDRTQRELEAGGWRILRDGTLDPTEKEKHTRLIDKDLEQLKGVRTLNERIQASETLEQALANQAQRSTVANLPLHPSVLEKLKDALIPAPERSRSPLHFSLGQQVESTLMENTAHRSTVAAPEIETKTRVNMGEILMEIYGSKWRELFINADLAQLSKYVANRVDQSGDIPAQVKARLTEIAHDPELAQLFVGQDEQGKDLPLPASLGKFVAIAKDYAFKHLEQAAPNVETVTEDTIVKHKREKVSAPRQFNSALIAALSIDANGSLRPSNLEDLRHVRGMVEGATRTQHLRGPKLDNEQKAAYSDLVTGIEALIEMGKRCKQETLSGIANCSDNVKLLEAVKTKFGGEGAAKNLRQVLLKIPHADEITPQDLLLYAKRFETSYVHEEKLKAADLLSYIERIKAEQARK